MLPAAGPDRRAAAHGRRRLDRRRQVDAGQLAGRGRVSEPGVLRPTTRSPVLVHNPDDADWFDQERILPDLARTSRATADPGALQLVAADGDARGPGHPGRARHRLGRVERNRSLAAQLLAAADLWLFVTSAARYADQVPWDFLKRPPSAAPRSPSCSTGPRPARSPRSAATWPGCSTTRGLQGLAAVHRRRGAGWTSTGLLPPTPSRTSAAGSTARRRRRGARTAWCGRRSTARCAPIGPTHLRRRRRAARRRPTCARGCERDVDDAYDRPSPRSTSGSADGTLLRGEVLARWQEFVGTGELLRALETEGRAGCATGSPTRSRASRSRPSG